MSKNNREIPHNWWHANERGAGKKSSNIFYDLSDNGESVIYSYGRHFPIAIRMKDVNGNDIVLFNDDGYSVSTNRHKSYVRQAIPRHVKVFEVPNLSPFQSFEGVASKLLELREHQLKASITEKRVQAKTRQRCIDEANRILASYLEFCELTGITPKDLKAFGIEDLDTLRADAKAQAEEAERQRKLREKAREKALKKEIAEWVAGERQHLSGTVGVKLRVSKDGTEIETSHGARIPVEDALKVVPLLKHVKEVPNRKIRREGLKLGQYSFTVLTREELVVGCHHIPVSELDRIAKQLGVAA